MNFPKSENLDNHAVILRETSALLEQHRTFVENTPDIIYFAFSESAHFLEYISSSITFLTGYSPENFYASPELFKSLVPPDDFQKLETNLKLASVNSAIRLTTFSLRTSDDSFAEFEMKIIPKFDKNHSSTQFFGIARKITPHQMPLYDIAYWERLSAISQMASSVAHEIRNPMTTIRGYLQLFSDRVEFDNHKKQLLFSIDEIDRADLIIKEYLSLNQNKLSNPALCQLNDIICSIYPLLKADANNLSKDVKIHLNDIPKLYLDENEIRQLILNIVKNGLESMTDIEERTTVSISTCLAADGVIMAVKDQGPGIAPAVLANMGKAFVTTKKRGTGLGLNVCYKIAQNHDAEIKVESNPDGTVFKVKFPLP
jgi:signal transduction histidine kinase